jgi:hypothetical protein
VGAVVQPPDPNIQPQRTGATVFDAAGNPDTDPQNGELSGTTIRLKTGFQMIVMFNLKLTGTAATYDLTIAPQQGTTLTGWSPQLVNTPASILGPDDSRLVQFSVLPSGPAPSQSGTLVFRIRRRGATSEWFQEFNVELLP